MLRHRVLIALRSILVGWAALLALTYLIERPLLLWTAPVVGDHWIATAKLSLDCMALAATGWAVGRLSRPAPLLGALAFAVTLALSNLDSSRNMDVRWLIQLAGDAFRDSHYVGPLATTAAQYLVLVGSLVVGVLLSRPSPKPLSLFRQDLQ